MCAAVQGNAPPRTLRWDSVIAVILALWPVCAAVPLASNRPVFWAVEAMLIGLLALVVFARQSCSDLRAVRWMLLLGAMPALYAVVQSSPLGGVDDPLLAHLPPQLRANSIAVDPGSARIGALRILSYVVYVGLVVLMGCSVQRRRIMGWVAYWGVLAHAIYGLLALLAMGDAAPWGAKTDYLGFATGCFLNRNAFGAFLGLGAVLGAALTITRVPVPPGRAAERAVEQMLLWLSAVVIVTALLATGSRMAFLSSCLAVMSVLLGIRRKSGAGWLIVGIALAVLIGLAAISGATALRGLELRSAWTLRMDLYHQVGALISARPWRGYGLDGFAAIYEIVQRPPVVTGLIWDRAHSSYLALWAELGVIVGSAPMLALLLALIAAWRNARGAEFTLPVAALGAGGLVATHALFDFSFEISANVFLLLLILGLGVAPRGANAAMPPTNGARAPSKSPPTTIQNRSVARCK